MVYELHDIVLQLSGELDINGVPSLDDCVVSALREGPRRLVLELSALEFVDVVGVGGFVRAQQRAEKVDVELIVDSPVEAVRRLLELPEMGCSFRIR